MSTSQTALFTVSGTWTCPAGVTAVWVTMSGAGGGAAGTTTPAYDSGASGGSGECVVSQPMSVVPATVYTVTVGVGGVGSAKGVKPGAGTSSSFNGFTALKPLNLDTNVNFNSGDSGGGGGFAAASPGQAGGYDGHFGVNNGANQFGKRESRCYTGGNNGGFGSYASRTHPSAPYESASVGINGGTMPSAGTSATPASTYGGGGGGGGNIWGGTDGGSFGVAPYKATANPTHYGAGAGGTAQTGASPSPITGGDGATGVVMLMWVGP